MLRNKYLIGMSLNSYVTAGKVILNLKIAMVKRQLTNATQHDMSKNKEYVLVKWYSNTLFCTKCHL